MNIPEWVRAIGVWLECVEDLRMKSRPESWTTERFSGVYQCQGLGYCLVFRGKDVVPGYIGKPRKDWTLFTALSREENQCTLKHDEGKTIRALASGCAEWEGPQADHEVTLLAVKMVDVESDATLMSQNGPLVKVCGDIEVVDSNLHFVEMCVVDNDGASFRVCINQRDYVYCSRATFFGALSVAGRPGKSPEFNADLSAKLPSEKKMAFERGISVLHMRSTIRDSLNINHCGQGKLKDIGDLWNLRTHYSANKEHYWPSCDYYSFPDEGVFTKYFLDGSGVSVNLREGTARVFPGYPLGSDNRAVEDLWGGRLLALEGTVGFIPDDVDFDAPPEPQNYGDECVVTARIVGKRREANALTGIKVVHLDVQIEDEDAHIIVPLEYSDFSEDFERGAWFVGKVVRVEPAVRECGDYLLDSKVATENTSIRKLIDQAMRKKLLLRIKYRNVYDYESQRVIRPVQVNGRGEQKYLVAWDESKNDWRTFIVGRILQAEITQEPEEYPLRESRESMPEDCISTE